MLEWEVMTTLTTTTCPKITAQARTILQSNTLKLLLRNMVTKSRLVALVQHVSCSIPLHILEPSLNFFFSQTLHSYGARKVAIFGVGPIGCTPFAITSHGTNGSLCVDTINLDAQLFNKKLVSLVDQLNKELTDAKFIYVDIFGIGSGDPSLAGMISQTSSYFPLSINIDY